MRAVARGSGAGMLRRLCQSVLLSLFVLGLAVPASSYAMATQAIATQAATAVPCPDMARQHHCSNGVDLDCLAGCMAATAPLAFAVQPWPAALHRVLAQAQVMAPDAGYRRLLERPPSVSV